jgi:hypothetical protein
MKSRHILASVVAGLLIVSIIAIAMGPRIHASTVVRSRSNISNNRLLPGSGIPDVLVLCESCTFPGLPDEPHLVLMNRETGDIFAYSDEAVVGKADPVYLSTLSSFGKRPVVKPK